MASSNNYQASIRIDLENASELEKEIAAVFSNKHISHFRAGVDAAFRSRKGFLSEQKELVRILSQAKEQLAAMVREGQATHRVHQELTTVDRTLNKVQGEILALERERTEESKKLLDIKKALLKQGDVDDATNQKALGGIKALSKAEQDLAAQRAKEAAERADREQHLINTLKAQQKERARSGGPGPGAKIAEAEKRAENAIVDRARASVRAGKREEQALARVNDSLRQRVLAELKAGEAAEEGGQKAERAAVKNTLASQNVLRVIQDSQYGMMGMANNIEQLSESFGRMYGEFRKNNSAAKALGLTLKSTFMPLVMGPMALATIVTLTLALAQGTDKLKEAYDRVRVAIGLMTEAQLRFNNAARDGNRIRKDIASGKYTQDYIIGLNDLDEARSHLEFASHQVERTSSPIPKGMLDYYRWENREESFAGRSRDWLAENVPGVFGGLFRAGAALDDWANAPDRPADYDLYKPQIESHVRWKVEEAELQNKVAELQAEKDAEDRYTGPLVETDKPRKDSGPSRSELNRGANFDLEMEELRIAAMKDGPDKRQAEVRLRFARQRREYDQQEGYSSAQRERLKGATYGAEAQALKDAARDEDEARRVIEEARIAAIRDEGLRRLEEIDHQHDLRIEQARDNAELEADELAELERLIEGSRTTAKIEERRRQKEEEDREAAQERRERWNAARQAERFERQTAGIAAPGNAPLFGRVGVWQAREIEVYNERAQRLAQNAQAASDVTAERDRMQADLDGGEFDTQAERDEALAWIDRYNERLAALKGEELRIIQDANNKIIQNEAEKRMTIVSAYGEIASQMSAAFGSMASVVAGSSEEAFRNQQQFLYSQAVMDALSAGVGIYRSYVTSPIPPPLNGILAAAQSTATVAGLMAKAKEIKNMSLGGGAGGGHSAQFVQLNGAVTGKRIREYEGDRAARDDEKSARQNEAIEKLTRRIGDLKVVMDDRTAVDVYNTAQKVVKRNRI